MFVRDLIDTTNVYLQMIEKYCQGSIMVQSKVKSKKPTKKKAPKEKVKKVKKKTSPEEVMVRFANYSNFLSILRSFECLGKV